MAKQLVVTIGRQFGSGGHEIGNLLAERLDIPLYDNNQAGQAHTLSENYLVLSRPLFEQWPPESQVSLPPFSRDWKSSGGEA